MGALDLAERVTRLEGIAGLDTSADDLVRQQREAEASERRVILERELGHLAEQEQVRRVAEAKMEAGFREGFAGLVEYLTALGDERKTCQRIGVKDVPFGLNDSEAKVRLSRCLSAQFAGFGHGSRFGMLQFHHTGMVKPSDSWTDSALASAIDNLTKGT